MVARSLSAEHLADSISTSLTNFARANQWSERASEMLEVGSILRPPAEGRRIYFDAGLKDGATGLRVVAANGEGGFVKAAARHLGDVREPMFAKVLALKEAIVLAEELNWKDAVITRDALNLIQIVHGDVECPLSCVSIIEEVRSDFIRTELPCPCWIPRVENTDAHLLARFARSCSLDHVTWDSTPEFLLSNVAGRFPAP